jgi:hypothetical protein
MGGDSLFHHCHDLATLLRQGRWAGLGPWLFSTEVHPPLPYIVATLLALPLGFGLPAVRASGVLLHAAVVVQVFALARSVTGSRTVALLGAALAATVPMMAGWFRLEYHEPVIAVLVVATLQLAISTDLRAPGRAALLGLCLGLGALTKLSFDAVLLLPALIFLGARLRQVGPRALAGAGIALAVTLILCGWWYATHLGMIVENWTMSTATSGGTVESRLVGYLWRGQGNLTLTALGLVGVVVAYRERLVERLAWWLLVPTWLVGLGMFIIVFDFWGRYILPLLPVTCALAGVALGRLLRLLPPGWQRGGIAAVVAFMLAASALANLHQPDPEARIYSGLLVPDRRDHGGLGRALASLRRLRAAALLAADSDDTLVRISPLIAVARLEGDLPPLYFRPEVVARDLAHGTPVYALTYTGPPERAARRSEYWEREGGASWRWLAGRKKRLVGRYTDGTDRVASVWRIAP